MDVELNASQIVKESRLNNKENNIVYSSKPHPPTKKVYRRPLRNPARQRYTNPRTHPQSRIRPQRRMQESDQSNSPNRRIKRRIRTPKGSSNARLLIRNLTKRATNEDLRTMFEKAGPLKRCGINWNDIGESKGTADVEYLYEKDARAAMKRFDCKHIHYNDLMISIDKQIKGVPIRIEMKNGQRNQIQSTRNIVSSNHQNKRTTTHRTRIRRYRNNNYNSNSNSQYYSNSDRNSEYRAGGRSNRGYDGRRVNRSSHNSGYYTRRHYKNYNNFE